MSVNGLNKLLNRLLLIILAVQVSHYLVNRAGDDADFKLPFVLAFHPDNAGLAAYFGAMISTVFMIPLLYLTRWRATVMSDSGWAGKIFRPDLLEVDETVSLGKWVLRVLLFFGVILPMVAHVWLMDRWLFDTDVYIKVCSIDASKRSEAISEVYPEIRDIKDTLECQKKLAHTKKKGRIRHCIPNTAMEPFCRIETRGWKRHFELSGASLFGGQFRLGYNDRIVSYIPILMPGIMLLICVLLLLCWLDTLAMIFVPRIRLWPRRPPVWKSQSGPDLGAAK